MKKILLTIGILASSILVNAQTIFNYGFETPSSELTVGKLDYINFKAGDIVDSVNATAHSGTKALLINNSAVTANNWDRALKFRNLNLEENTAYRVSFWVKGVTGSNIRTRLMVGTENNDVAVVAKGNAAYDYSQTGLDSLNWVKLSSVYFYSMDSNQVKFNKVSRPDSVLSLNKFLNLNVFNPGKFYIDDISIEKSSIKGITYNGDVIKVDFGYTINEDEITAGEDYNIASLPVSSVVVTLDGVELDVEAVEVQKGKGFFIFLATDFLDDSAEGKLKISFTNPVNDPNAIKYTDAKAPFSWDPSYNKMVLNFTDELAINDINLNGSSKIYEAPFLKSSTPENNSFDLPLTARTFKIVYSKKVDCSSVSAKLGLINLTLAQTGYSDTLTFTVPVASNITDGSKTLKLTGVVSEAGTPANQDDEIYYDYGTSLSGQIDTILNTNWRAENCENGIPAGWVRVQGVTSRADVDSAGVEPIPTSANVGASRMKYFPTDGEIVAGWYFSGRGDGSVALYYGACPLKRLYMKKGRHVVKYYSAYWDTQSETGKHTFDMFLKDSLRTVVLEFKGLSSSCNAANSAATKMIGTTLHDITIDVPSDGNYILEFQNTTGWNQGIVIGDIFIQSIPSKAAEYKNLLANALSAANSAKITCDSSLYDGPDKTTLSNTILSYTGVAYTAPSEYIKVSDSIKAVTLKMYSHKTLVDNYFASVATCNSKVTSYGSQVQYNTLVRYADLLAAMETYKLENLTLANNTQVKTFTDSLNAYSTYLQGVIDAIPVLKHRMNLGVTVAKSLRIPVPQMYLSPAESIATITDDDNISNALNAVIKQYVEGNIAADSLLFKKDSVGMNYDSLKLTTLKDSINLTCFIKNPNFYTTLRTTTVKNGDFPGWNYPNNFICGDGYMDKASDAKPVVDSWVNVGGGNNMEYFEQTITGLPAGIYHVGMKTRTSDNAAATTQMLLDSIHFYVKQNETTFKVPFVKTSFGLPSSQNTWVQGLNIPTDGSITIGVTCRNFAGYVTPTFFFGDPLLYMVQKLPSYTYTGVKEIQKSSSVKEVQYYTIQGSRISTPTRGLNIVRTIYTNGKIDVQKVMIK